MQTVDIILSCFLGYGIVRGLWKGFFYELASFVSLALGVYITIRFSYWVKNWIAVTFDYQSNYLNAIAFILTFILTVIGVMLLAGFLTKMTSLASLGWVNKGFGALFGLLKMILFLSVILYFFTNLNKSEGLVQHEIIDRSILFHPIMSVSKNIYPILEEYFPEVMEQKEALRKAI